MSASSTPARASRLGPASLPASAPAAPPASPRAARATTGRLPRHLVVSAWAVPVLVLGQFAMLAVVPVALLLVGAVRDSRLRPLRWRAGILAAAYATPLAIWALRPDGAPSLSKDMNPVFVVLIVAASALLLSGIHARKR